MSQRESSRGVLISALGVVFCVALALPATAQTGAPTKAPVAVETLSSFAKARRFEKCLAEVARFESLVLRDHEYTFSAHVDERKTRSQMITAMIDARHKTTLARSLVNVTVMSPAEGKGCSIVYERTVYWVERCDVVQKGLAPEVTNSQRNALGAVVLDLTPSLTLALIPVGKDSCVTVAKEVAF